MNVTTTPAPKSSILLEVEVPADRLDRAVGDAVRRLARRTKVPGFRPGKAPRVVLERVIGPGAVLDEAVEQLVQDSYREALVEKLIVPLTNPDVELVQAAEGQPLIYKATVQVRPEVRLGDYRGFNFRPEIPATDDAKVDEVVEELRDQNASLVAVEGRGAKEGDYAVVGFVGTRDGEPFDGGTSERFPLIIGQERLIPGFETHLLGMTPGEHREFDIDFPADYGEESLAGRTAHFAVDLRELREKVPPELDDDLARSMGPFDDLPSMRAEIRQRLERNALDRARHDFSDRIIEYAVANATLELPEILVDQEVEVMHDEFRASLARQGISEEAYLKVVEKTEADLHAEFRPQAEHRVKVLLVLSKIAEAEGVTISDAEVDAEVERGRRQWSEDARLVKYLESERGRNFIRSTLRRSTLVEKLVDEWLAAHPEHPPIPHAEEPEARTVAGAESAAAVGVTDPGSILSAEDDGAADPDPGVPADGAAE